MTPKPLAIVDLDDVLGDFANLLIHSLNNYTKKRLTKNDLTDFFAITTTYGISFQEFTDVILNDDLMNICAPVPGAHDALNRLVKDHQVVIVTARTYDPDAYDKTERWLSMHHLPHHQLLIPEQNESKSQAIIKCFLRDPVVCFDDALHNAYDLSNAFRDAKVYVPRQPWNTSEEIRPEYRNGPIHRAESFRHAVSCYYADYVEGR